LALVGTAGGAALLSPADPHAAIDDSITRAHANRLAKLITGCIPLDITTDCHPYTGHAAEVPTQRVARSSISTAGESRRQRTGTASIRPERVATLRGELSRRRAGAGLSR
jgi:hypothetical protein